MYTVHFFQCFSELSINFEGFQHLSLIRNDIGKGDNHTLIGKRSLFWRRRRIAYRKYHDI